MQILFGLRIYKIFLSFSLQEVLNPFLEMEKILLKQYDIAINKIFSILVQGVWFILERRTQKYFVDS